MKRIVIDTGVVVSALLKKDGVSRKALIAALKDYTPLLTITTLYELNEVLNRPKFAAFFSPDDKLAILELILERAEWIEPKSQVDICRDKSDNMFLSLALDGKAHCILSRDLDLISLNPFQGIPIVNPTDFLNI